MDVPVSPARSLAKVLRAITDSSNEKKNTPLRQVFGSTLEMGQNVPGDVMLAKWSEFLSLPTSLNPQSNHFGPRSIFISSTTAWVAAVLAS